MMADQNVDAFFAEVILPGIKKSLAGVPVAINVFLKDIPENSPAWDKIIEADRFTLRQMIAHIAEWQQIDAERIRKILAEDNALIPQLDPDALAVAHKYETLSPKESLVNYLSGREAVLALLDSIKPDQWSKPFHRNDGATWELKQFLISIIGHDGYHLTQTAQWVEEAGK
jgi:hypothetical protein